MKIGSATDVKLILLTFNANNTLTSFRDDENSMLFCLKIYLQCHACTCAGWCTLVGLPWVSCMHWFLNIIHLCRNAAKESDSFLSTF